MSDVVALTEALVAIPSVSGDEAAVMAYVATHLESNGWKITRQEVTPGRENVWATQADGPGGAVTLSTHLDTVPPFIGPRREAGRLYGRGTCDAKGIAAAMICAAGRLLAKGENRVDLLFVVGEEKGSDGAIAANGLPATSSVLINGEPTEGRLASAAKGSLRAVVRTAGRAAHSAYPEEGHSAIVEMLTLLQRLEGIVWPSDPVLGPTTVNMGMISGGEAANIVPAACQAELMIRLVGSPEPVKDTLSAWADGHASIEYGACVPPTRFLVPDGFETGPVSFTTDAPLLSEWGEAMLYGPGSIHHAHRPDEHIEIDDLEESVLTYERLISSLLRD